MTTTEQEWPKSLIGEREVVLPPEPNDRYSSPLRMGQWDHLLIGAFMPLAEDQMVSRTYYGLRHTETWFDLFVRNSDGQYHLLSNVVQSPAAGGALRAGPWLPFPVKSSPEGLMPDLRVQPWDGGATQELTPDRKNRYTVEARGSTDVIAFNETALDWHSTNGDIALSGELVAPAMQMILPWREPDGATDVMYYTNQFYKLDGSYGGEDVSAYSMIEHMWGYKNYADTWWVQNRIVHSCHWVTTFDDGVTEMGKVMWGEYGARGVLIANSQGRVIVNTTEFNAETSDDGRIVFTFVDGPQWEFLPEIRVVGFPLVVGLVKRVGEARTVVSSHGLDMSRGEMSSPVVIGQTARPMR